MMNINMRTVSVSLVIFPLYIPDDKWLISNWLKDVWRIKDLDSKKFSRAASLSWQLMSKKIKSRRYAPTETLWYSSQVKFSNI